MPAATRSLSRAARERAGAREIPYTQAREELLWMRALLDEGSVETEEEADAYVTDPANQTMCTRCGWTWGMICPECVPGCACSTGCSGWRHTGYANALDVETDDDPPECPECGGVVDGSGYGCDC